MLKIVHDFGSRVVKTYHKFLRDQPSSNPVSNKKGAVNKSRTNNFRSNFRRISVQPDPDLVPASVLDSPDDLSGEVDLRLRGHLRRRQLPRRVQAEDRRVKKHLVSIL